MSQELKPCPFAKCDSAPVLLRQLNGYFVFCRECGVTCPRGFHKTPEAAAAAWNERTPEPWQSPETAPKDGNEILLRVGYTDNSVMIWMAEWSGNEWVTRGDYPYGGCTILDSVDTITGWKPVPTP